MACCVAKQSRLQVTQQGMFLHLCVQPMLILDWQADRKLSHDRILVCVSEKAQAIRMLNAHVFRGKSPSDIDPVGGLFLVAPSNYNSWPQRRKFGSLYFVIEICGLENYDSRMTLIITLFSEVHAELDSGSQP